MLQAERKFELALHPKMEKTGRQRMASVYKAYSGCSSLSGDIRDRYSSSGPPSNAPGQ